MDPVHQYSMQTHLETDEHAESIAKVNLHPEKIICLVGMQRNNLF